MDTLNILGLETPFGYRTVELVHGDVCDLSPRVDILAISAFARSYTPNPGTVIAALEQKFPIDVSEMEASPEIDLRPALGVWVSTDLAYGPAAQLLCVELIGGTLGFADALDNVFSAMVLLDSKGYAVKRVALPLLGSGNQRLNPTAISSALVRGARDFLGRSRGASSVMFVERDVSKATAIADAMDSILGRARVSLPRATLSTALLSEIGTRLAQSGDLFNAGGDVVRRDWLQLLETSSLQSFAVGVHSRRLVELMLNRLGIPSQHLAGRIRELEKRGDVAPWICGYMNVLRHLGNESVHEHDESGNRRPEQLSIEDVHAGLFCVARVLDFWVHQSETRDSGGGQDVG